MPEDWQVDPATDIAARNPKQKSNQKSKHKLILLWDSNSQRFLTDNSCIASPFILVACVNCNSLVPLSMIKYADLLLNIGYFLHRHTNIPGMLSTIHSFEEETHTVFLKRKLPPNKMTHETAEDSTRSHTTLVFNVSIKTRMSLLLFQWFEVLKVTFLFY